MGVKERICDILSMVECNYKSSSKILTFNGGFEKLKARLSRWRGKLVSQAGRSTLIKSVPEASTQHSMQSFLRSKVLTNKADKLVGDYFGVSRRVEESICIFGRGINCVVLKRLADSGFINH